MSFFDDRDHDQGHLTALLATEVGLVQATTGPRLGVTIQNYVCIGAALVMSFIYSWQLTLIVIGVVPLMAMTGLAATAMLKRTSRKHRGSRRN